MSTNNVEHDARIEESFESRNSAELIRNGVGKVKVGDTEMCRISSYKFRILRHDKPALEGELSREEMERLCRGYSSEGDNLTLRTVSREFPRFTYQELKKILLAFGITKASAPLAPHVIEERSTDELVALTFQNKENGYLKKVEQDRSKMTEAKLKDVIKDFSDYKKSVESIIKASLADNPIKAIKPNTPVEGRTQDLILHLSDLHIGAKVSTDCLYENSYSLEVVRERIQKLLNQLQGKQYDTIVINLLGDMLDGMNGETTRGGNPLPQNMDNYEQVNNYINIMTDFMFSLHAMNICNHIKVYSVKCGNHDGIVGYTATMALFARLELIFPNYEFKLFNDFFGYYEFKGHKWIICHGKDDEYMKKGLPLNLGLKEKNMIYDWLDSKEIYGRNIHFIKGDLHTENINSCYKLDYRNVLSFFGASDYSAYNFDRGNKGVSYELLDGTNLLRGCFIL